MRNDQKGNSIIAVVVVVLLIALTGSAVYFWQKYENEKSSPITAPTTSQQAPVENEVIVFESNISEERSPVVVFTPDGLFTEAEREEILTKVINPFIDWEHELNPNSVVSMEVEKPSPEVPGYKYNISYILEGGGYGGFLFGMSEPLEWWVPGCMGGCNPSAAFAAKYPEVVAQID